LARTKTPQFAERILAAAARLFAMHRFHEARMEDIAAAAEVGKGTLYRYFPDKEQLYLALLSRSAEQMSRRVHAALDAVQGPRRRLEALVGAFLGYFEENPHLFDLIQHAEALHRPPAPFPWDATRKETMALVRRILEEGRVAGEFDVGDPDLAVLLLLGGLRAVMRFGERPHAPDLARRITDNFLHGVACGGHARVRPAVLPA
jgi:AcrR family transcriptional regulator